VYLRGGLPSFRISDGDTAYAARFAIVANGRYYGGEFESAEDASLASGGLEVVLVEKIGNLARPDVLARILAKSPLDRATRSFGSRGKIVAESAAARGAARGRRVPVQIDGEVWGILPMSFRIERAALRVIR
jgi:diacylglycerol kinase (ATP)